MRGRKTILRQRHRHDESALPIVIAQPAAGDRKLDIGHQRQRPRIAFTLAAEIPFEAHFGVGPAIKSLLLVPRRRHPLQVHKISQSVLEIEAAPVIRPVTAVAGGGKHFGFHLPPAARNRKRRLRGSAGRCPFPAPAPPPAAGHEPRQTQSRYM